MSAANSIEHPRLLLVEDETKMAWEIAAELKSLGYLVRIAATEEAGLEAIRSEPAALLILDRMLSGADSLSMIDTLRSECIRIPVLVISALAGVDERIRGLKAGGDDYLTKPFVMEELAARVEALLRRSSDARATSLRVGPLEMDLLERKASRGQRVLDLLPAEFKLLEYLMRHPGQTITRTMILEDVWRFRSAPQTNLVDVHIGKLRRKVDEPGEAPLIRRIRSAGFVLDVND
ncbi:response regulator transcription factor [Methylocapsa acidiphila]|uniref:response regulator transcription factor n=1 Tax=Methylocapsa acidiphila TaxID=133552 RepID=UPI00041A2377|nr:response regulator transcription factor [Methylocapsa acidiphila]